MTQLTSEIEGNAPKPTNFMTLQQRSPSQMFNNRYTTVTSNNDPMDSSKQSPSPMKRVNTSPHQFGGHRSLRQIVNDTTRNMTSPHSLLNNEVTEEMNTF